MIEFVLLWAGIVVWGLFFGFVFASILRSEIIRLPFRRPWQCIKHLLPWFWITERHWQEFQQGVEIALTDPHEPEWKRRVELKRHGHLGIFINNLRHHWWKPKYHLFIIKTKK